MSVGGGSGEGRIGIWRGINCCVFYYEWIAV